MSYVNKRTQIFSGRNEKKNVREHVRLNAKMKDYLSALDLRSWSDIVEERRQHFLEYEGKSKEVCKLILQLFIENAITSSYFGFLFVFF